MLAVVRIERLGEKAVILRDLPCSAFELTRWLNGVKDGVMVSESGQETLGKPSVLSREVEPPHQFARDQRVRSFDSQQGSKPNTGHDWLAQDDAVLFEEAVASYETVGVYFSEPLLNFDSLAGAVSVQVANMTSTDLPEPKLHEIPVCYELGPDLQSAAKTLKMSPDELIDIHLRTDYQCYSVGFSPGFAYLGFLDDRIASLPRLASPRPRVKPGSVGITGRQTAVYPSATPGGWNLIGKCPLKLVDVEDNYFPIEAGDQIRFKRIDEAEFAQLEGERL